VGVVVLGVAPEIPGTSRLLETVRAPPAPHLKTGQESASYSTRDTTSNTLIVVILTER
jgi:hypothetical protein